MGKFIEGIKDIFSSLTNNFDALIKVIFLSKWKITFPDNKSKTIALLANGPSLNSALEKIKKEKNGIPKDIMVLNFFCNTELFAELKPNYYIICDPIFTYNQYQKRENVKTFYNTLFNSSWEINLFVPQNFKKSIDKIIKENNYSTKFIKVLIFNDVNFNKETSLTKKFIDWKLGGPRPTTVSIPALLNCIHMNYKNIYIAGIDLSLHKNIRVNKNNVLEQVTKHFYDDGSEGLNYKPWVNHNNENFKVSSIFKIFYYFFYSFDFIANYSKSKNVNIINFSDESFLDQFTRK